MKVIIIFTENVGNHAKGSEYECFIGIANDLVKNGVAKYKPAVKAKK